MTKRIDGPVAQKDGESGNVKEDHSTMKSTHPRMQGDTPEAKRGHNPNQRQTQIPEYYEYRHLGQEKEKEKTATYSVELKDGVRVLDFREMGTDLTYPKTTTPEKPGKEKPKEALLAESKNAGSGLSDAEVAVMYGLVDENGEYDEDAVQALQEQLAEAAGPQEEQRDSTRHDMIFHWVIFVSGFIVAVAGGVSKTLDTLQWGWDNTVLANISVAWVLINMVPFAMALGYAYLPHNKNVHVLLVSLSWTIYAMCVLFCVGAMLTKVAYGNPKFM